MQCSVKRKKIHLHHLLRPLSSRCFILISHKFNYSHNQEKRCKKQWVLKLSALVGGKGQISAETTRRKGHLLWFQMEVCFTCNIIECLQNWKNLLQLSLFDRLQTSQTRNLTVTPFLYFFHTVRVTVHTLVNHPKVDRQTVSRSLSAGNWNDKKTYKPNFSVLPLPFFLGHEYRTLPTWHSLFN